MNFRPLEPHSSTLPNCATPSRTLRRRPCRREKRYYSSIFAGECQAAERHAARRKGGGRAANGRAGKHAPRRGDGDVPPKGRPSGKHRAPRGRAGACARRGGAPARLKKLRKRRPASASSASCRKQRPAPTNGDPAPEKAAQTALLRPQTATCAHQQLSTSANDVPVLEKAAPTAPRARRQRLMPASGDLRPPTATTHQKKPRRQRPTPASSIPRLPTMFPCLESRTDSAQRSQ